MKTVFTLRDEIYSWDKHKGTRQLDQSARVNLKTYINECSNTFTKVAWDPNTKKDIADILEDMNSVITTWKHIDTKSIKWKIGKIFENSFKTISAHKQKEIEENLIHYFSALFSEELPWYYEDKEVFVKNEAPTKDYTIKYHTTFINNKRKTEMEVIPNDNCICYIPYQHEDGSVYYLKFNKEKFTLDIKSTRESKKTSLENFGILVTDGRNLSIKDAIPFHIRKLFRALVIQKDEE